MALSHVDVERELAAAVRRSKLARKNLRAADAERDELIRAAHAAGVGPSRLAELTGLSKPRIDQIRRRARL